MEEKRYTEEDLIDPALFEMYKRGGKITTGELIKELINILKPAGQDAELLFGRKDTRFSQKVRNLISHRKIYPKYVEYDGNKSLMIINNEGEKRLLESNYFLYNSNKLIENIYDEQNDEDISPVDESDDFENIDKKYVECEPVNYSVYELKRRYDRAKTNNSTGVIKLDDSFQRNTVWTRKQKSQLIESLLLGIPIPYIYVYEGKNSNLIVIDGRQRLSAIFDFLDNKYSLIGLEFLTNLEGKKCKDLVDNMLEDLERYRAKLEDAHLHVIKVGFETSEIFKLKIFQRVNQGGTKLNNQELRHALHQGAITNILKEISDSLDILSSSSAKSRMKDRYLILRYISMRLFMLNQLRFYGNKENSNIQYNEINTFLANSMDAINTFDDKQIDEIKIDFVESYKLALELLGNSAFRLEENSPINMILFEITLLFISMSKERGISLDNLTFMIDDFKNYDKDNIDSDGNTPFFQNIKYHRDSKKNFEERINWINNIFSKYKG